MNRWGKPHAACFVSPLQGSSGRCDGDPGLSVEVELDPPQGSRMWWSSRQHGLKPIFRLASTVALPMSAHISFTVAYTLNVILP